MLELAGLVDIMLPGVAVVMPLFPNGAFALPLFIDIPVPLLLAATPLFGFAPVDGAQAARINAKLATTNINCFLIVPL